MSTLRTYTPLRRCASLKPVNAGRRAKAFARNFGDHASFVRSRPCVVISHGKAGKRSQCSGRMEAAHVHARGMGGAKGDKRDLVPVCRFHHGELDGRRTLPDGAVGRKAFEALYGIDLDAVAADLWRQSPENQADKSEEAPCQK